MEMLNHDMKLFLKLYAIDKANPSSLEKFSCDPENTKKQGTNGIPRHVWMRKYSEKIAELKKPIALVIQSNGGIFTFPSAYSMVKDLPETELIAGIQRIIEICQDLFRDSEAFKELKETHSSDTIS